MLFIVCSSVPRVRLPQPQPGSRQQFHECKWAGAVHEINSRLARQAPATKPAKTFEFLAGQQPLPGPHDSHPAPEAARQLPWRFAPGWLAALAP